MPDHHQPNTTDASATDQPPAPRHRLRAWHLLLIALAILLGGHLLWLALLHKTVEAELQAIRDAGYPASPAEVDASYESVPDAENAAPVLQRAFDELREPTNEQLLANLPVPPGEAEPPGPTEPLPEKMHEAIDRVLADNAEALERLHEGAVLPRSRYPIDLSRGIETLLPHLTELRNGANLLRAEAMARLAEGQPEPAAESIEAMLGLARSLRDEPVLISQLVRRALHNLALDTLDRLLAHTELPDATLSDLQQILAAAETPQVMGRTMAAERIYALDVFKHNAAEASALTTTRWDTNRVKMVAHRYSGLLTLDRLACIDVMSRMVEAAERPLPERTAAMERAEKAVRNPPFYAEVTPSVVPTVSRAVEIDVRMIARLRAAQTALAAERYRLAHDDLPDNLDALTPEFIDAVPADPFTGDPLKHRKLDTGITVYSVNRDGTDDGGKEPGKNDDPFEPGFDVPFILRR